jgi:hypothetical protein
MTTVIINYGYTLRWLNDGNEPIVVKGLLKYKLITAKIILLSVFSKLEFKFSTSYIACITAEYNTT